MSEADRALTGLYGLAAYDQQRRVPTMNNERKAKRAARRAARKPLLRPMDPKTRAALIHLKETVEECLADDAIDLEDVLDIAEAAQEAVQARRESP